MCLILLAKLWMLEKQVNKILPDCMIVVLAKLIDESFLLRWERRTYTSNEYEEMQRTLFEHLCPLLIIKMLPMKTFDDLNSPVMYAHLSQNKMHGSGSSSPELDYECISAFLLNRALREFEFEDVRKLSAELCGRIHPQVLLPVICSKLDLAVDSKNVLKIKACLFSICTSLVVRGRESLSHPLMHAIKRMIETVLLWPCLNADSVSKVQHGCIDCLALMICVELQAEESITDSMPDRIRAIGKKAVGDSVVTYVMNQFVNDKKEHTSNPEFGEENCESVAAVPLTFRLCMGNVLISTCQKISESYKKHFAGLLLPFLLHSLKFEIKSEIRAACIQVLFSAVYHLRSAVVPYAYDLLKTSFEALRKESEKERMAGAKLIASLMASEDVILENISVGLLEA
ncbi:armadillo/beta-catenin-like repeat-containing protein, partial [Trifolium pratense]